MKVARLDRRSRRNSRWLRGVLVSAQIGALVAAGPTTSFAEEPGAFAVAFDVIVLRQLHAIRMLVGAVALVPVSLFYTLKMPFDGDAGALAEVADILVVEPANHVFRRPLGEDFAGE